MEKDVGIPTTLFGGPPEPKNIVKLANSQIGFMNIFARPLFESVTDILPAMVFAVDEIKQNQELWKSKIEEERAKELLRKPKKKRSSEGWLSPRSGSPLRPVSQPELSHPEGLPASHSLSIVQNIDSKSPNGNTPSDSRRGSAGSIPHLRGVLESSSPQPSCDMSRRSSLGCNFGHPSPHYDSASFSRRSSGAFPGANILNPSITRRRSSNSIPSQLYLGLGPDAISNPLRLLPQARTFNRRNERLTTWSRIPQTAQKRVQPISTFMTLVTRTSVGRMISTVTELVDPMISKRVLHHNTILYRRTTELRGTPTTQYQGLFRPYQVASGALRELKPA